jgi:PHD/YefM family antitoxin component YafN of YafNO toxin-antitoxin module
LATILKRQEIELLISTRDILEEILETLEVAEDPRTSKALKEGLRDVKAGRVRPYKQFVKELRSSHEL